MNMVYQKGDFVGFVAVDDTISVPMPRRWFLLRVHPNHEARVMRAFVQRNISAYLPTFIRSISRSTGQVARKPHLGRRVVAPLLPGLIFVPDFDFENPAIAGVDNVKGFLMFGERYATLTPKLFADVRAIEAHLNTPRSKRAFRVGQGVRFVDGALSGFSGVVERLDSRGRLRVFVDAIKRGVSVETSEAQLEPA